MVKWHLNYDPLEGKSCQESEPTDCFSNDVLGNGRNQDLITIYLVSTLNKYTWSFWCFILTYFIIYWCYIYSCNIYLFKVLFSLVTLRKYLPTPIQYTEDNSSVRYCLFWPGLSSSLKIIIYPFSFLLPMHSSIWADLLSQDLLTFKLLFLFSSFKVFATHFRILCSLWRTLYWIHILNYIYPILSNSSRAHLSKCINVWCFFVKCSFIIAFHEVTDHACNCVPGNNDEAQSSILTDATAAST